MKTWLKYGLWAIFVFIIISFFSIVFLRFSFINLHPHTLIKIVMIIIFSPLAIYAQGPMLMLIGLLINLLIFFLIGVFISWVVTKFRGNKNEYPINS